VQQVPQGLGQEIDRIAEPVRRQAQELVNNLNDAIAAPQGTPLPEVRLPAVQDVVRGLIPEG
jgi:hypothetical protein